MLVGESRATGWICSGGSGTSLPAAIATAVAEVLLSLYPCVCACVSVSVCACFCVLACSCVCVCVSACSCACVSACSCTCMFVCPCVRVSVCPCVRVSVCLCAFVSWPPWLLHFRFLTASRRYCFGLRSSLLLRTVGEQSVLQEGENMATKEAK
ncbi:hypothetical protein GQ42DRAFT_49067 [Ramicandelaber brevisporus]|nr:hypothetical protein GQ42DRAFT_49067 [Ramicandelaber brevisporus]